MLPLLSQLILFFLLINEFFILMQIDLYFFSHVSYSIIIFLILFFFLSQLFKNYALRFLQEIFYIFYVWANKFCFCIYFFIFPKQKNTQIQVNVILLAFLFNHQTLKYFLSFLLLLLKVTLKVLVLVGCKILD